jgi:hypothetical protein
MDELPRDARAFLDLARDAHDPPERTAAHARVHARLMSAIAAPPALGTLAPASAAATRGWSVWISGSKIMIASAVIALGSAAYWAFSAQRQPVSVSVVAPVSPAQQVVVASVQPAPVPHVEALAVPAMPLTAPLPGRPATKVVRHASGTRPGTANLAAETSLLARASSQLAHDDVAAALVSIENHRRRFGAGSQLAQEREGLQALAQCLGDQPSSRAHAQRYIARAPSSVLVARLELACGL